MTTQITPDQIPNLKVNYSLSIPNGSTLDRPDDLGIQDEVGIYWNKTECGLDIFENGEWVSLLDKMNLVETFMTRQEYYSGESDLEYLQSLHQSINIIFLELQQLRHTLGQDLLVA